MGECKLDEISYHTVKKFDLISSYVGEWAEKIMHFNPKDYECKGIIFIDCMCNCGEYIFKENHELIKGTGLRVIEKLIVVAHQCKNKTIEVYFNDISSEKVEYLKEKVEKYYKLPSNMKVYYYAEDSSIFLRKFSRNNLKNKNTLLIYDPYNAKIDWKAIDLFLNTWGEVIINHMISDPVRGVKQTKNEVKRKDYETTYQVEFEKLLYATKEDYEELVENNIKNCIRNKGKKVYISSIPFYIKTNVPIYNLIHISFNKIGFCLFKTKVWKITNGQSAVKYKAANLDQLAFDLGEVGNENHQIYNYTVQDIALYIIRKFTSKGKAALEEIYDDLDNHPIFPCDGFKKEIKSFLKIHGCKIHNNYVFFKEEQ